MIGYFPNRSWLVCNLLYTSLSPINSVFRSWNSQLLAHLSLYHLYPSAPLSACVSEHVKTLSSCGHVQVSGRSLPECKPDGGFKEVQCAKAYDVCWCVDKDGHDVPRTRQSGKPNCTIQGMKRTWITSILIKSCLKTVQSGFFTFCFLSWSYYDSVSEGKQESYDHAQ